MSSQKINGPDCYPLVYSPSRWFSTISPLPQHFIDFIFYPASSLSFISLHFFSLCEYIQFLFILQ
uniref:Putative ovule protein n=1 Tax=Solanum chacoense TaxID=4108 RepID=A0A0V0GHX0_SOLCH